MKTRSLIFAVGLLGLPFVGAAEGQQAQFSMHDIRHFEAISFGLGDKSSAAPIRIDLPVRAAPKAGRDPFIASRSGDQAARLRDLIGHAEAGRAGYDAVQHGARIRPSRRPTDMTVAEIFGWIKATPNQPHAIGRYQFIPATLRGLVRRAGVNPQQRFSPALQDHLANLLLEDAGFGAFTAGKMSHRSFMYNLAGIWAGLPLPSGRSRYEGYAGNRSTISWNTYRTEITRIFSQR
ncbi:hypothetical protein Q4543_20030 [Salipiger sp. 1_MG-2023]|uniref:hypothetical protein n=1 Tax=Salipiger sp. 1_MG-2023 TaxID=3062665 RepID=UPI0026E1CE22|nr:hypothetical protein [Salipiger sp. 1_MG-2023]MDO6587804.1 hypothetical protein [Salipiger sp. 1_MG-2023]